MFRLRKVTFTRRDFIKIGFKTFVWITGFHYFYSLPQESLAKTLPYGSSVYGQGTYIGSDYKIYLPTINKEKN